MSSLPPNIDQRSYHDLVQQTAELVSSSAILVEGRPPQKWLPPDEYEIDLLAPDYSDGNLIEYILNQHLEVKQTFKEETILTQELVDCIVFNKEKRNSVQVKAKPGAVKREVSLKAADFVPEKLVGSILAQDIDIEVDVKGKTLTQELIDKIFAVYKREDLKTIRVKANPDSNKRQVKRDPDPGWALIRIFSHMAALVSNRLNQVPDKNFLAFLDLLGAQLQPPRPARVPLTFHLAEGSPSEAVVPAHTQISAPPGQDTSGEVVFETEQKLVVTPAQLQAVYVKRPDRDNYQEQYCKATGTEQNRFSAFDSSTALEHYFYIACEEIFGFPGAKTVTLNITLLQTKILKTLPVTWSYWNGKDWNNFLIFIQGLKATSNPNGEEIVVASGKVGDRKQRILTALETRFPKNQFAPYKPQPSDQLQEVSLTIFADPSANPPYSTPSFNIMLTSALLQDSAGVYADHVELARLSVDANGAVTVLRSTNQAADPNNGQWQVIFPGLPIPTACSLNHGAAQKWLRASFPNSAKDQLRQLEAAVQPDNISEITAVETIEGSVEIDSGPLVPALCLFNSTPLDLSKDFYPFGEAPDLNDTFYVLLHEAFLKPDVTITLNTTINSPKNNLPGLKAEAVTITWEVGQGTAWEPIGSQWHEPSSLNFISEPTTVTYRPEVSQLTQTTVNGQTGYWIRARITNGFYGIPSAINKYVIFNEVGLVNAKPVSEQGKFKVNVAGDVREFLQVGNQIRLVWYEATAERTIEKVQEHPIEAIDATTGKSFTIACTETEGNAIQSGAKILRRSTISETTAPIYAPPLLQSFTLTYRFTLTEPAVYCAYNDFTYQYPFSARLKAAAAKDQKQLTLVQVDGLAPKDAVVIRAASGFSEHNVIEAITPETQQVRLKTPLQNSYEIGATASRIFTPFTPVKDHDPTLYLGFSQPDRLEKDHIPAFNNQPISLYCEVELPPPGPLPDAVNSKTVITQVSQQDARQIKVADARGWQVGDRLQVQPAPQSSSSPNGQPAPTSNSPVTYFIDRIDRINHNQITLTEVCKHRVGDSVIRPESVQVLWQYSSSSGWQLLPSVQDDTQAFFQRGLIRWIGPADLQKQSHFGQELYWLRAQWTQGNFRVKPVLRRLLLNTTWAVQAMTMTNEALGASNGERNQVFSVSHTPVLEEQLEVLESTPSTATGSIETAWVRWQEVADFYCSGPADRHYILNRQQGTVQFGDGQSGMIPPRSPNRHPSSIQISYKTGGGIRGNRAAKTITQLKTTIPYIDSVTNLEAAGGGAEQETLDQLKERVPKRLRHRDRAVTEQDFIDLTFAASTEVARVQVITPTEVVIPGERSDSFDPLLSANWLDPKTGNPMPTEDPIHLSLAGNQGQHRFVQSGRVKVVIVPDSRDRQPTPSLALLKQVEDYLRQYCQPGIKLVVTGPIWQKITITAEIVPRSLNEADDVRKAVLQRLDSFLHPLYGGRGNAGWAFGRYPHRSDLYAVIQSVMGVDHVHTLSSDPEFVASSVAQSAALLATDCFIFSGSHQIKTTFHGGTR